MAAASKSAHAPTSFTVLPPKRNGRRGVFLVVVVVQFPALLKDLCNTLVQAADAAAAKKAQDEAAAAEKKVRSLLPCVGVKQAASATRHHPLQAAAAARIAGKPDIFAAMASGDLALVQDHVTADASCVGRRDGK